MKRFSFLIAVLGLLSLTSCGPITPAPDYTIRVVPKPDGSGYVAVPPDCPRWADNDINFLDNQPLPQFGCADKRNLALMVDRPEDLLHGRDSGTYRGTVAAGTIMRYDNNQTRGLVYPASSPDFSVDATTGSAPSSGMTGETPVTAAGAAAGK